MTAVYRAIAQDDYMRPSGAADVCSPDAPSSPYGKPACRLCLDVTTDVPFVGVYGCHDGGPTSDVIRDIGAAW